MQKQRRKKFLFVNAHSLWKFPTMVIAIENGKGNGNGNECKQFVFAPELLPWLHSRQTHFGSGAFESFLTTPLLAERKAPVDI